MTPEIRTKAVRHLARRDPVLKRLIGQIGPCTLEVHADPFAVLARSIISQQISSKAALSIGNKVIAALRPRRYSAKGLLAAEEATLRAAGLSGNKLKSLRDLAEKVDTGQVRLKDLHRHEDEEVIAHLLPVRGIGRWTAEMFLIFCLGRTDVLPIADLGLRADVRRQW